MLNLFLALLLSSFGAESLSQTSPDEVAEPNKLQEAVDRINRFCIYVKSHVSYAFKRKQCRLLHRRPTTTPGSTGSLSCGRDWQTSNGQVRELGVYLVSDHDEKNTCPHQHTVIGQCHWIASEILLLLWLCYRTEQSYCQQWHLISLVPFTCITEYIKYWTIEMLEMYDITNILLRGTR